MQSAAVPALVIRRTYDASPQRVYQAWADPELARQFLCPAGMTVGEARIDVRVGGEYRIEMLTPSGERFVAHGVYREVVPAARLSMTWQWEEENPADEHETLLTVEFNKYGSGTELILTHERLASLESRAGHSHGWTSMLQKLDNVSLPEGSVVAYASIAAAPARVFQALVSDDITKWWVRPGVFDTREWKGDAHAGGQWTASGIGGGNPYMLEGEFVAVDAPRKLVHTWHLAGAPGAATTVTYVLEPQDGGTRLTIRHDGFPSTEAAANTRIGWETSLSQLEELFKQH